MMRGTWTRRRGAVVGLTLLLASCGADRVPTTPPSPTPVASTPEPPTPTPTPTATPNPSPSANASCGSLAPGPVTRLTVSPREHNVGGANKSMKVLVRQEFTDEVVCVDMDQEHRIDFNLNQRNDDNKECCWQDTPRWYVSDPNGMVTSEGLRDDQGFIYRVRIDPQGRRGRVGVEAFLDGVDSYPWESRSHYSLGPLIVEAMPADELYLCNCTYIGNAGYMGPDCPKSKY